MNKYKIYNMFKESQFNFKKNQNKKIQKYKF